MDVTSRTMLLGSILVADVANPRPEDVDLQFMRYRLGAVTRFSNHPAALTIAEHQKLCGHLARHMGCSAEVVEWAEHHDDHEFATGDLATPLQHAIAAGTLNSVQRAWDAAIVVALGLTLPTTKTRLEVAVIDRVALALEWRWALGRDLAELGATGVAATLGKDEALFNGGVPAGRRDELRHGRILLGA